MTNNPILFLLAITVISCGNLNRKEAKTAQNVQKKEAETTLPKEMYAFNADSAYAFIEKQVAFGPRVPETKAHDDCAKYLEREMNRFGAKTTLQKGFVELYNGEIITAKNIIASFDSEKTNRILLCAHWDSRPFADQEKKIELQQKPILGANDGASGVGILMEIARCLGQQKLDVGIDIIFFDAEDYGTPEFYNGTPKEHTWCLGSQYWVRNPHVINYHAKYGILLDMVGDENAVFMKEQVSNYFAPHILEKVWNTASNLGFDKYFIDKQGGVVTDDHLYINQIAKIPCIDIIHYNVDSEIGFPDYWHTHNDDISTISKTTLNAVGQTVLAVLFNEK